MWPEHRSTVALHRGDLRLCTERQNMDYHRTTLKSKTQFSSHVSWSTCQLRLNLFILNVRCHAFVCLFVFIQQKVSQQCFSNSLRPVWNPRFIFKVSHHVKTDLSNRISWFCGLVYKRSIKRTILTSLLQIYNQCVIFHNIRRYVKA